jgi:uncharacterized protein YbjQ (UPF0145 family)
MANIKISELPALIEEIDKEHDALAIVDDGPRVTKKITPDNLILPYAANEADIITGTRDDLFITPRALADTDLYHIRFFICTFNADDQLKLEDKAFQDIPIALNEFHLVSWTAMCHSPSTFGDIVFSIKFNNTSMFSSPITIDQGHYSSTTSIHPAEIDIPNSEITTGGILSAEITSAGIGATYVKVTLGFRKRIGSGDGESDGGDEGHSTAFADVTGPEGADNENVVVFDGTSGKLIKDSGVNINDIIGGGIGNVVGPASSINNNVVFFNGITGKLIKDSGLTLSGTNTGDQDSSDFTHNDLTGLQGGDTDEYYHLTSNEKSQIELNDHNSMTGIQGGDTEEYYHLTEEEKEQALAPLSPATTGELGGIIVGTGLNITAEGILSTGDHNDLQNIQGGDTDEYYHLTSSELNIVQNTSGTNTGDETVNTIGDLVHNSSEKTSLLLSDEILVTDSSSSFIGKKITFDNLARQIGLNVTGYVFRGEWIQNSNDYQYPPSQTETYVKVTNYESGTIYYPYFATDPSKLLIGLSESNSWRTDSGVVTNQRFHIDLGTTKIITSFYYENFHRVGSLVNQGSRIFTFWGSNNVSAFNDLTYENDSNWSQLITDVSELEIHSGVNSPDPKYVNVTNTISYRYYAIKISSNWGGTSVGLRRLELYGTSASYIINDIVYVDDGLYKCILDHTSDANSKPGSGINWETYWVLIYKSFHNLSSDLQGGDVDEYYHLSSSQRQKALGEMYPGVYTAPTITDNGNGTITVGNDGVYHLFTEEDGSGDILSFSITGGTFAPTLDVPNYLVADYNNGVPEIRCLSSYVTINGSTIVPIITLYIWSGEPTNISQLSWDTPAKKMTSKLTERFLRAEGFSREYGVVLGEQSERIITVSEGAVWFGSNRIQLPAFNSTTDLLREWVFDGAWDATAVVQYDTLHYQGVSGKEVLSDGKFGVIWVYRKMVTTDPVGVVTGYVFGTQEYNNLGDALESQPPTSIPEPIYQMGVLVGRIVFEKGASSAEEIDSAFEYTFSGSGVTNHNDLANMDGGGEGGYYHLTGPEYIVVQNTSGVNTGDQNDHNLMDDLQGGDSTSSQYYHITEEIYNNLLATKGLGGAKYSNIITISPTEDEIEGEKYKTVLNAQEYLALLSPPPSATNIWGILISGTNSENIDVATVPYVHYLGIKDTTRLTGQITSTGLNLQSTTDQRFWVKDCIINNLILGNLCGCQFEGCRITGGNIVAGSIGVFHNCKYQDGVFPSSTPAGLGFSPCFFNSLVTGGTFTGGSFVNTTVGTPPSFNIIGSFQFLFNKFRCLSFVVQNGGTASFYNSNISISLVFTVENGGTLRTANSLFTSLEPIIMSGGTWTKLDRHNTYNGDLQGGTSGQYYHLTSSEYTVVQNTSGVNTGDQNNHNMMDNLRGGDSTSDEYFHLTEEKYNQVQANNHNDLNGVQGGAGGDDQYYHVPAPPAENYFVVANETPAWDVKSLSEVEELLELNIDHNDLKDLQGGDSTSSEYYHLTEQEYNHVYNGEVIVKSTRGGGLIRKSSIVSVTLSDSTSVIEINIPPTSRIVGVQLIVDELITSGDGATSWSASFYGGSIEPICSEISFLKDTTVDSFASAIVLTETDIEITTDTGTFSGGVITAVCYYEVFDALTTV